MNIVKGICNQEGFILKIQILEHSHKGVSTDRKVLGTSSITSL